VWIVEVFMNKEPVSSSGAPKAIGPYSQAIRAGGLVFVSGQIPLDPTSGIVAGETIEAQTERVLKSIQAILETAGSSMANVAKTTVYLKDLTEFPKMNEVYARFFPPPAPARATVEVANLPKGVKIEIDAVAVASK
jgi:2-iminobutanoate/2-iminopropanoate deaminase